MDNPLKAFPLISGTHSTSWIVLGSLSPKISSRVTENHSFQEEEEEALQSWLIVLLSWQSQHPTVLKGWWRRKRRRIFFNSPLPQQRTTEEEQPHHLPLGSPAQNNRRITSSAPLLHQYNNRRRSRFKKNHPHPLCSTCLTQNRREVALKIIPKRGEEKQSNWMPLPVPVVNMSGALL